MEGAPEKSNIRPWAELQNILPPLSSAEREGLKASVEAEGVLSAVLVLPDGRIVDGHHRWEFSGGKTQIDVLPEMEDSEALLLGIVLNRDRRQLSPEQKKELASKLRRKGLTQQQVSNATGIPRGTVAWAESISNVETNNGNTPDLRISIPKSLRPDIYKRVKSGQTQAQVAADYSVTQGRVAQIVAKEKEKEAAAEKRRQMLGGEAELPGGAMVVHGDFREATASLPDDSVDLIFTDPPYGHENVKDYGNLAAIGARILKPKGSLIAYVGHYALRQVLWDMGEHLKYWWLLVVKHGGSSARLQGKGVLVEYKPLVWFVRGGREVDKYVTDVIYSRPSDKKADDWEQGLMEAQYCIEQLTDEGGLVVDPFCGSGTTLVAALGLNRRCWGCDSDIDKVGIAKSRVAEWSNQAGFTTG